MNNYISKFNIIVFLAIIISAIPFINIPFSWITVFFHEISHGITSILTGGKIEKILLHISGSGLCYTSGGSRFFILLSGYMGAILWGCIIYSMADFLKPRNIRIIIYIIIFLLITSLIFWSRDLVTWAIIIFLLIFFASLIKLQENNMIKLLLKFIGIYILFDAIRAPLYLFDGRHYGDGASLADLTILPEFIWIILWFSTGVFCLYYLWKNDQKIKSSKKEY